MHTLCFLQEAKEQVFWPFLWAGNVAGSITSKASSLLEQTQSTATPALADIEGSSSEQYLAEPVTAEIEDDDSVDSREEGPEEESDKESERSETKV